MKRSLALVVLLTVFLTTLVAQQPATRLATPAPPPVSARDVLIARAKSLELDTPYVPPPGDPLEHHTAGFAKIMCSAVFITGLDPDFAAENVGYFTGPYSERKKVGKPVIDRDHKEVRITMPNGVTRVARYLGDQGCVTLPVGKDLPDFHARQRQERSARRRDPAMADGRCAAHGASARRRSMRPS